MSQRASHRQADIDRAVRVAKKHGYEVRLEQDAIRLLPIDPDAPLPSPPQSESAWREKLASWRGSA